MPFNIYSGYKSRCRATNWRQKCKYARKHNFNTNTSITNPTMSTGLSGAVKYRFVDYVHLQLYILFMLLLFVILFISITWEGKNLFHWHISQQILFYVKLWGSRPKRCYLTTFLKRKCKLLGRYVRFWPASYFGLSMFIVLAVSGSSVLDKKYSESDKEVAPAHRF